MISRRALFAALAGLVAVPSAGQASINDAYVDRMFERLRPMPPRELFPYSPFVSMAEAPRLMRVLDSYIAERPEYSAVWLASPGEAPTVVLYRGEPGRTSWQHWYITETPCHSPAGYKAWIKRAREVAA